MVPTPLGRQGIPQMNTDNAVKSDNIMKLIERRPRVYSAVNKAKGGYFEESKKWNTFSVISQFLLTA